MYVNIYFNAVWCLTGFYVVFARQANAHGVLGAVLFPPVLRPPSPAQAGHRRTPSPRHRCLLRRWHDGYEMNVVAFEGDGAELLVPGVQGRGDAPEGTGRHQRVLLLASPAAADAQDWQRACVLRGVGICRAQR